MPLCGGCRVEDADRLDLADGEVAVNRVASRTARDMANGSRRDGTKLRRLTPREQNGEKDQA